MLSNEEILELVKNRLSAADLPVEDIVKQIHFGKNFSETGIYVYCDEEKYYITEIGFRGSEGGEHCYCDDNELIHVITWNCLVTYIYEKNRFKPDSKLLAFEYLKKINDIYHDKS